MTRAKSAFSSTTMNTCSGDVPVPAPGRDAELLIGERGEVAVPFAREGDDAAAPRLHLLHVRQNLLIYGVLRRHEYHRHVGVDQRDRPVLHLGGGISLRVDVADLLELEGTFERHREIHTASQVEKVG